MKSLKLISTAIILFVAQTVYGEIEDKVSESFNVGKGGTLTVESHLGSIKVTTHSSDKVDVTIIRKLKTNSKRDAKKILEDLTIDFNKSGDDLFVTVDLDNDDWGLMKKIRNKLRLEFEITVPEEYNVDLKTSGGSISVDDLNGSAITKTSGGSLKFGQINGPVNGHTSGGSITLQGCNGDAEIKTSGGSLKIGDVDGDVLAKTSGGSIHIEHVKGSLKASTSGGSIKVTEVMGYLDAKTSGGSVNATLTKQPETDCSLSTSGGSINVFLADDLQMTVNARTSGGRVRTEFPVTIQGEIKKNKLLNADINGGGPGLTLKTSGGNININKI
jgi:hypothetical protein